MSSTTAETKIIWAKEETVKNRHFANSWFLSNKSRVQSLNCGGEAHGVIMRRFVAEPPSIQMGDNLSSSLSSAARLSGSAAALCPSVIRSDSLWPSLTLLSKWSQETHDPSPAAAPECSNTWRWDVYWPRAWGCCSSSAVQNSGCFSFTTNCILHTTCYSLHTVCTYCTYCILKEQLVRHLFTLWYTGRLPRMQFAQISSIERFFFFSIKLCQQMPIRVWLWHCSTLHCGKQ